MAAATSGIFWALTVLLLVLKHHPQLQAPNHDAKTNLGAETPENTRNWLSNVGERKIMDRSD